MKTFLVVIATLAALAASPQTQAADVGVSIQISEPGVYGRIDIGRFPQPQLVVQRPVLIHRPVAVQAPQPVYLWVPPGHRKNWRKHCGQYSACGVPVYFVRDDWYGNNVHGNNQHRNTDDRSHGRGHDKGHDKGHGKRD